MAVQKLRGGMKDEVNRITKRLLQVRRCEGVVYRNHLPVIFRERGYLCNIHTLYRRVGRGFDMYPANRLLPFQYIFRGIQIPEVNDDGFNTQRWKHFME